MKELNEMYEDILEDFMLAYEYPPVMRPWDYIRKPYRDIFKVFIVKFFIMKYVQHRGGRRFRNINYSIYKERT